MCSSCLYFHMRTDKELWPRDRGTNRREMTDACSLWQTCGSVSKHGGIVAWYEALDQAPGRSPVHLLLHEKTKLHSKGFGAHFRKTNAELVHQFFSFMQTFPLDWPDWLSSQTPRQTCKFSPWSGWHAGCHQGPPWGPSEPPSNGKQADNDRIHVKTTEVSLIVWSMPDVQLEHRLSVSVGSIRNI